MSKFFLDLLFPLECLNCQTEGNYLCTPCFQKIKTSTKSEQTGAKTNLQIPELNEIYIAGDYEDKILSKLIIKYKYNFLSPLGKILADFLINFWNSLEIPWPRETLLIIPIPLSKKRLRWRGFNQAEILAREFCTYYKILNNELFDCELNLDLKRQKHRSPQANLNEAERLINIKSAFAWKGKNLSGQNIILIDDVTTTGATLNEAAKTLRTAGANKVYALVLAKG
ncbi:MAG: ComF family protein [Candidatus Falkowbacteria bacterium]